MKKKLFSIVMVIAVLTSSVGIAGLQKNEAVAAAKTEAATWEDTGTIITKFNNCLTKATVVTDGDMTKIYKHAADEGERYTYTNISSNLPNLYDGVFVPPTSYDGVYRISVGTPSNTDYKYCGGSLWYNDANNMPAEPGESYVQFTWKLQEPVKLQEFAMFTMTHQSAMSKVLFNVFGANDLETLYEEGSALSDAITIQQDAVKVSLECDTSVQYVGVRIYAWTFPNNNLQIGEMGFTGEYQLDKEPLYTISEDVATDPSNLVNDTTNVIKTTGSIVNNGANGSGYKTQYNDDFKTMSSPTIANLTNLNTGSGNRWDVGGTNTTSTFGDNCTNSEEELDTHFFSTFSDKDLLKKTNENNEQYVQITIAFSSKQKIKTVILQGRTIKAAMRFEFFGAEELEQLYNSSLSDGEPLYITKDAGVTTLTLTEAQEIQYLGLRIYTHRQTSVSDNRVCVEYFGALTDNSNDPYSFEQSNDVAGAQMGISPDANGYYPIKFSNDLSSVSIPEGETLVKYGVLAVKDDAIEIPTMKQLVKWMYVNNRMAETGSQLLYTSLGNCACAYGTNTTLPSTLNVVYKNSTTESNIVKVTSVMPFVITQDTNEEIHYYFPSNVVRMSLAKYLQYTIISANEKDNNLVMQTWEAICSDTSLDTLLTNEDLSGTQAQQLAELYKQLKPQE